MYSENCLFVIVNSIEKNDLQESTLNELTKFSCTMQMYLFSVFLALKFTIIFYLF